MTNVYELKKKKNKKHRLLKAAASVLILAFISVIAAVLITNHGKLDVDGFIRLVSGTGKKEAAAEFSFNIGLKSVFAEMNGGLVVCSGSGVQVYDVSAKKMFSEAFEMSRPAICTNGAVSAVYDLGGKSLKMFDLYGVTKNLPTEEKIISASLNRNGWLALCVEKTGGFKGRVTVYDGNMKEKFYWDSAKGYVLSAVVSPDNKSLAVLTLTDEGSRIVFLSLDSGIEKGACARSEALALEIRYLSDDTVLTAAKEELYIVKPDGSADTIYNYAGKYLTGYSLDGDGFAVLALNDYMVGDQGQIVTVDHKGKVLATIETDSKILSISAKDDYLAVLFSDSLVIYDRTMKEYARFEDTAGAEQTIMRTDGKAFLITSHSAAVCSIPAA